MFLTAVILAFPAPVAQAPDDPPAIVREATLAVEGDSVAAPRSRWIARRSTDSRDPTARLGLATLARLTYDYPAAERLYGSLIASDSTQPDRFAAYARLGRAWGLEDQGWSTESGTEFVAARKVARAAGDRRAEAEALVGMAFPRGRVEGMAVGIALLDTAETIIPHSDYALRAQLLRRRSIFLGVAGDSAALAVAASSGELGRRAGLLRDVAQGRRAAGKILQWKGHLGEALVAFEEADTLFQRSRDRTWAAVNNIDRADVLLGLGHLGDMREALDAAIREGTAARSPYALGTAYVGFGAVAIELGDFATAGDHLRKAIAQYEALGDTSSVMKARTWLVHVAVATGDYEAGKREEHDILSFYGRTGEPPEQYMAHRGLAAIAMLERDWTTATRELAEARSMARRLHQPTWEWSLTDDEGRLALLRGDLTISGTEVRHPARGPRDGLESPPAAPALCHAHPPGRHPRAARGARPRGTGSVRRRGPPRCLARHARRSAAAPARVPGAPDRTPRDPAAARRSAGEHRAGDRRAGIGGKDRPGVRARRATPSP